MSHFLSDKQGGSPPAPRQLVAQHQKGQPRGLPHSVVPSSAHWLVHSFIQQTTCGADRLRH